MKYSKIVTASLTIIFTLLAGNSFSQLENAIDADAIMQKIVEVEAQQRAEIRDVIFDAEYVELEKDDNGNLKEKMRLEKTITLKFSNDSVQYTETFDAYYVNGKLMSEDELAKIATFEKLQQDGRYRM